MPPDTKTTAAGPAGGGKGATLRSGPTVAPRVRLLPVAALALAAFVVAGCVQGPVTSPTTTAPPTEEPTVPPAPGPITLGPLVELGSAPGEPNVAVAADGTIHVVSITTLWSSTDGGATYTQQSRADLHGGGDGDLAIDGDGTLHYLGLGGQDGPIPYQRSTDGGETFSDAIDLSDEGGFDREWIHATPEGRIYAVWRDDDGVVVNTSTDGGLTWQGKVSVMGDALAGPITTDPRDPMRVYVPLLTFGGAFGGGEEAGLELGRSDDGGATWTVTPVTSARGSPGDIFTASIFPVVSVDADGTLYLVVSVKSEEAASPTPTNANQYAVFLHTSSDGGESWSEAKKLSPDLKVAIMPWVAAGAPGRLVVTWYQNTVGLPNDNLPDLWDVYLSESLDGGATFTTVKVTEDATHIGSICTSGTLCFLTGGDRSLLDFFEVAIQPNGQPVVAWSGDSRAASTPATAILENPLVFARAVASGPSLL